MGAGGKYELITIERETRVRERGAGTPHTWAVVGQMWADVKWIGGSESEQRGALRSVSRYRMTVYANAADDIALSVKDRVLWNDGVFNIRERPRRQIGSPDIDIITETDTSLI